MNNMFGKRFVALLLAVASVIGIMSVTAFATETEDVSQVAETTPEEVVVEETTPENEIPEVEMEVTAPVLGDGSFVSQTHDTFSTTASNIAPGVTQSINYAYAKDGKQMVYYVLTADINRDDVVVQTSYKDQYVDKKFAMEKLTTQMAFADKLYTDETSDRFISEYYKAVGGVNASFYNMTTGQPSGVTYLDGVQIGESASYAQFFGILKDGTAVIDYTKNLKNYEGNIWQACAGSEMLVFGGKDVTANATGSYNTDRHSRTCVGITADGKVVMMSLDGRQEPFSCGGTMHELAQIMLEQGCVAAINLDGGGSTTFAARQEGENEVSIVNRPSDGAERAISTGLIIASLAAPSNVFERATLEAEQEYVTPGSTVTITAKGVSPAGTAAEIPADATWNLADSKYGTVANGVFTSNGTTGDAVVQMMLDGAVVGKTTIHVVIPDTLTFAQSNITVPYEKSVPLKLVANYGYNEVALKNGDVTLRLSNENVGTLNDNVFTATADTTVAGGTVTATLVHNDSVNATANIVFGRASKIVYDFESGASSIENIYLTYKDTYAPSNPQYYFDDAISVVTAETGKVKNGTYSMRIYSEANSTLVFNWLQTRYNGWNIDLTDAESLSFWMYIPEGSHGNEWDFGSAIPVQMGHEFLYGTGWQYFTVPVNTIGTNVTNLDQIRLYRSDNDNADTNYLAADHPNYHADVTYYLDDITVNYSSAVEDNHAPLITDVSYSASQDSSVAMNGQTINTDTIIVTANVADDGVQSTPTGLDVSSVKVYVDGVKIGATCSASGVVSTGEITLANGSHIIRIDAADKNGNAAYVEKSIVIAKESNEKNTIVYAPADDTLTNLPAGSLYWMDLTATAIEKVEKVEVTIDLDLNSDWELDHMELADGFAATYTINSATNDATITITREGDVAETGEYVIAQLPIRVWTPVYSTETSASHRLVAVESYVEKGLLTETDDNEIPFGSKKYSTVTEFNKTRAGGTEARVGYHVHTAEAIADKAANCTEAGYTDRTFCKDCNSVVVWGTKQAATGHTYTVIDGVLKCACGQLFNGEYTDGKTYVDGIIANGWIGESYYTDGMKLTGIQKVVSPDESGEYFYNFGEDGVCAGKTKYTGLIVDETGIRYAQIGVLATGWKDIDGDYYYFYSDGYAETESLVYYAGKPYYFDETGKLISGFWHNDGVGTKYYYGPSYYNHEWAEIDGKTYYFDANGRRMEGWNYIIESGTNPPQWYQFDEEGALLQKLTSTGLFEANGELYYTENGISKIGLIQAEDGYYYYFKSSTFAAVKNTTYWVSRPNDTGIPAGNYEFDENGRMVIETEEVKNGIVEENGALYYYVDGVKTYAGLIQIEGDYYYVNSSYKVVTTKHYWVNKTNGLLPAGYYDFGPDGKMIVEVEEPEEKLNGIVEENGTLYYYVDGVKTYAGLIKIDGDYYYVNSSCKVVTTKHYWVNKTNGELPAGYYDFGPDGKMIVEVEEPEEKLNGIVEENGTLYYYVDGVKTYAGLIMIDGDYYYVNSSCKVVTTTHYWVNKTNGELPAGFYDFGPDGKMIR